MGNAAGIPEVIACGPGEFAAFLTDADISTLLRKGALEELGGRLDVRRNALTLVGFRVDVPLKVGGVGHHALLAVSLGKECALLGMG